MPRPSGWERWVVVCGAAVDSTTIGAVTGTVVVEDVVALVDADCGSSPPSPPKPPATPAMTTVPTTATAASAGSDRVADGRREGEEEFTFAALPARQPSERSPPGWPIQGPVAGPADQVRRSIARSSPRRRTISATIVRITPNELNVDWPRVRGK